MPSRQLGATFELETTTAWKSEWMQMRDFWKQPEPMMMVMVMICERERELMGGRKVQRAMCDRWKET